jgi:hypothetical protein
VLGLPFETSYRISAVQCVVTNLFVAELILGRGPARPRRIRLIADSSQP